MKSLSTIIIFVLGFISTYYSCAQSRLNIAAFERYSGQEMPFMQVLLMSDSYSEESVTDYTGHTDFRGLKRGNYRILSKYPGYIDADTLVFIPEDSSVLVSLHVEKIEFCGLIGINRLSAECAIKQGVGIIFINDTVNLEIGSEDKIFEYLYHIRYKNIFSPAVKNSDYMYSWCGTGRGDLNYKEFNEVVFKYLDKKYGRQWRSKRNKRAIGF